ncbi:MAG: hypothetical protein LBJ21_02550, partial [Acidobacteriota bacterium]|nr:hypothetical protein [Acidobacteriota bacterium]
MALDLQPMTAAELIDRTISLYRKHFPLFVGIAVIPMLVHFLVSIVYIGIFPSSPAGIAGTAGLLTTAAGGLVLIVVQLFTTLFAQGATIAAVSDVYLERPSSIGKSYARLRGNLLNLLLAMILMSIVIG